MDKEAWTFKNIFQRQTKLAAYIIICATLVVIGASYALFFQVDSNTNNQIVEAGDLTFTYSNETVINNSICFEPMSLDEANLYASSCSYQLSIRNTGSLIADYNLFLVPREDNTADLSNLKIIIRQNGTQLSGYPKGVVSGEGDATHVGTTDAFLTGSINPSDTILYSAQIYVDDATNFTSSENKKVSIDIRGALVVSDVNPITSEKPQASVTLARLQALNPSLALTTSTLSNPDYSITAPREANLNEDGKAEQTSGLFETVDDYGISYYFRGDVTNNYVKFGKWQTDYYIKGESGGGLLSNTNDKILASTLEMNINNENDLDFKKIVNENDYTSCDPFISDCTKIASAGDDMYWRIVRINGDGTIRMIYDGTSAHGKEDVDDDATLFRSIGRSLFNENYNDNAYVGYMYGTPGSTNYNDTHANINNSIIKNYIDSWYQSQLTNYASYISDTLFCNDRSIGSDEAIEYATNNYGETYGKLGYGTNTTLYGGNSRVIEEIALGKGNKATLKCNNKNDAFTVGDTIKGNGALDYPVGLLTIDEANMAGGAWDENYNYYLITGNGYWTGSPRGYDDGYAGVRNVSLAGHLGSSNVNGTYGVRPVINLKSDSLKSGSGTISSPYEVE